MVRWERSVRSIERFLCPCGKGNFGTKHIVEEHEMFSDRTREEYEEFFECHECSKFYHRNGNKLIKNEDIQRLNELKGNLNSLSKQHYAYLSKTYRDQVIQFFTNTKKTVLWKMLSHRDIGISREGTVETFRKYLNKWGIESYVDSNIKDAFSYRKMVNLMQVKDAILEQKDNEMHEIIKQIRDETEAIKELWFVTKDI
ncbi:hypothetical protein [Brevibacillus brevis]|uniref:hypothetical protein n=1 Tax=Brevibacillus brevis TaxID=1393 RepID=UPI0007D8C41E|nr:hypothetical protein [Brevibacillus brevis]